MPSGTGYPRLLGDWGASNLRFAYRRAQGASLSHCESVSGFREGTALAPEVVIREYLVRHGLPMPASIGIGIACACEGDRLEMPARNWSFSIEALREQLGVPHLAFLNDGAALALGAGQLPFDDQSKIGGAAPLPGKPIVAMSVGTGLAVSVLVPAPNGTWFELPGYGGWATLPAVDEEEEAIIRWLRSLPEHGGHVCVGLPLCGKGLVLLYQAITRTPATDLRPADVVRHALAGTDPSCVRALGKFFDFLGGAASDLALTLGAGVVYIGGGVMRHIGAEAMGRSRFRARFDRKEPGLLGRVPVILDDFATPVALLGAEIALERHMLRLMG